MTCRYHIADGLRPDEACPAWTTSIFGDTLCLQDQLVVSSHVNHQNVVYFQHNLVLPETLVIRFRMRLVSGASTAAGVGPAVVYLDRNSRLGHLNIAHDEVFLRGPGYSRGPSARVRTTDAMHTYCITSWGDTVRVSQDSVPILEGRLVPDMGIALKSKNSIGWGENHPAAYGTSQWEFIEHNALACEDTAPRKSQPPLRRPLWDNKSATQARLDARGFSIWPMPNETPTRDFNDDFNDGLQPGWAWIREDPESWQVTSSCLAIDPQQGNLWRYTNDARNVLLREVETGDLVVTLAIETYLAREINGAYLVIYDDDDTFVIFGVTRYYNEHLAVSNLYEHKQFLVQSLVIQSNTGRVLLRAMTHGSHIQLQHSFDGVRWEVHDQFSIDFIPRRIGLMAIDGHEPASSSFVFFDSIEIREYGHPQPNISGESRP